MDLNTPISEAGRLLNKYTSRLEKLGIVTVGDFLTHYPFRYDNFSLISPIASVQAGEVVTVQGEVVEIKTQYLRSHRTLQKAKISDSSGELEVTWFNQPYIPKTIPAGSKISVSGRVEEFRGKKTMESPDYEIMIDEGSLIHTGRLVPVYPETRGVSSKWLRRQIYKLLKDNEDNFVEHLPKHVVDKHSLIEFKQALQQIHFPQSYENEQKARQRLAFDELLIMQIEAQLRRKEWNKKTTGHKLSITEHARKIDSLLKSLPFELTSAQKKAIEEIFEDFSKDKPMNRLLEGDVGSGKTVVGGLAVYLMHLNGYQSVIMAPTQILAQQHYNTLSQLLSPFGVKVDLVTGSIKYKKDIPNTKYKIPDTDILVGTHAVLSEKIEFKKLGLVIIDEQQRFGVKQRSNIRFKGTNPHVLSMTATPIPRTMALARYGDLDLSYLHELPKGRKIIKTWLVPPEKRDPAYEWIEKQIKETDSQVFIICPFIEESENMQTVKAATVEFERLQKEVFPKLKLGMLHGKMKAKDKDGVLKNFKDKKFDILVATPVVEVGIDIPNATIIVIEAAERFGLSQLHQLRGRVGRGDKQSYCLLFTESTNPETRDRLRAMEVTHVGAALAELDLKLRGPGELYGTRQHGVTLLKVAKFSDYDLVHKARIEAQELVEKLDEFPLLKKKIKSTPEEVSPD